MNNIDYGLLPMTQSELTETNGGGFAYDFGRFLRFQWIQATEGYTAAVVVLAVNSAINSTKK